MSQAKLILSPDKAFFKCETPDAEWEPEQINEDGLNLIYDDEEPQPAYLVITEDFDGPLPKNRIYQLIPLSTEVVQGTDDDFGLEDEEEEEQEPAT